MKNNKLNLFGIMLLVAVFSLFAIPNVYAVGGVVTINTPQTSGYVNGTYNFTATFTAFGNESTSAINMSGYFTYPNGTEKLYIYQVNSSANQSFWANSTSMTVHPEGTYSFKIRLGQVNGSLINSSAVTSVINDNTDPTVTVNYPTSLGDTMWGPSDDFEFTPTDTNIANCTLNSASIFSTQTSLTSGTKTSVTRTFTESNTSTWYVQCMDFTGHKVNSSAVSYNIVFGALGTQVIPAGTPITGEEIPAQITKVANQLKGTAIPGTQITWWIIIIIVFIIIILWKPIISKILK